MTERGLRAAMARYADSSASDPALRARVRVGAAGLSFELLRGAAVLAEREFESVPRRCPERVRAVAIALSLAFESAKQEEARASAPGPSSSPSTGSTDAPPNGVAAAQPAAKPSTETQAATAQPASDVEPATAPAPDEPSDGEDELEATQSASATEPVVIVQAGGGVLLGVLPEPALLFALGAGVPLGAQLQLELSALGSTGVSHPLGDGVVDAQLIGGQGALCLGVPFGTLRGVGCAGAALAAVPAQGRDFALRDRSTLTAWGSAFVAGALELPLLRPVSLRLYAGLHGSLVRPALAAKVDGARRDATSLPLAGVLLLQLLWAVP